MPKVGKFDLVQKKAQNCQFCLVLFLPLALSCSSVCSLNKIVYFDGSIHGRYTVIGPKDKRQTETHIRPLQTWLLRLLYAALEGSGSHTGKCKGDECPMEPATTLLSKIFHMRSGRRGFELVERYTVPLGVSYRNGNRGLESLELSAILMPAVMHFTYVRREGKGWNSSDFWFGRLKTDNTYGRIQSSQRYM